MSNFSFSHSVFKRLVLHTRKNQGLFGKGLKTSRRGHTFVFQVEHYNNECLCAYHTLLFYLERSKSIRLSRLLLILYKTFKNVSTSTIARWLRCVLDMSGIDISTFQAHSYGGAAVSATYRKGCSSSKILSTADWSTDKNFERFYNRQVLTNRQLSFARSVLE